MKHIRILTLILLAAVTGLAIAHSGGTDKYGCHKNHKTGVYHCH
jgi:hypothetical protein